MFIGVYPTPTANPLSVIDNVRKAFPDIKAQLPVGIDAAIAYDATEFIRASISEVAKTLGEAAIIVIVVIFLFLGSFRSTLIPLVTIPLSLIGVMIMLLMLGYSINLLTLLALVLAIGLVVDDAIVVVENIYRHIEDGATPFAAALQGAREIAGPVVAMTITLAAVYAPIGFVSGLTGALFREFAFTLAGSVIVSGIIALTLSPMMCSKLLKPPASGGRGFVGFLDRMFDRLRRRYERRLHRTLNFRAMTVLVLAGVLALTAIMYMTTPRELAPEEDQGVLFTMVKTPQYGNLNYVEQATDKLYEQTKQLAETSHLFVINGYPGIHQAFAGVLLKPWDQRARNQKAVMQDLSPKLAEITGGAVFAFSPPALPGNTGGPPMQFVIRTTGDYQTLADVVDKMQKEAQKSGLFIFTDVDLKFDTPQIEFKVDAAKANRLGINMADIGGSLATLLGGNYVNRFNLYGRSYEVIPQVPRDFRLTADWLTQYRVRTSSGELVPLSTVATISKTTQPNALTNFQQLSSATLQGVPFPGHTLGEALDFLKDKAKEIFPAGYTYDFQGESRQLVQEGNTLTITFIFSLILIFLVLAAQFESFRDPVRHPDRAADGDVRRALAVESARRHGTCEHQHLYADRPRHADRAHLQARHPDDRVRQPHAGRRGHVAARRDRARRRRAAAADPDDDGGDGRRHGAARHRRRRRRQEPRRHRHRDRLRHVHRHDVHAVRHAGDLYVRGARPSRRTRAGRRGRYSGEAAGGARRGIE